MANEAFHLKVLRGANSAHFQFMYITFLIDCLMRVIYVIVQIQKSKNLQVQEFLMLKVLEMPVKSEVAYLNLNVYSKTSKVLVPQNISKVLVPRNIPKVQVISFRFKVFINL